MQNKKYDLIIIGAGPAGLSAAVYAARYKLKTLIIAKDLGGTCMSAHKLENYLGYQSITGIELGKKFQEHAESYGTEIINDEVSDIKAGNDLFMVMTDANKYMSKSIILSLGLSRRKLNIPGEEEFLGKGVSYCATCDAPFFKDKIAGVVGGSDAAVTAALLLAEHAKKVYLVYRKDKLRAEPVWVERAKQNKKIKIIYNTNIEEVQGNKFLENAILDKEYEGSKDLKLDGLFIEVGSVPSAKIAQALKVELNKEGLIDTNEDLSTNIKGVFAAGDITTASNQLKQVVTAASEGAIAATSVYKYIKK